MTDLFLPSLCECIKVFGCSDHSLLYVEIFAPPQNLRHSPARLPLRTPHISYHSTHLHCQFGGYSFNRSCPTHSFDELKPTTATLGKFLMKSVHTALSQTVPLAILITLIVFRFLLFLPAMTWRMMMWEMFLILRLGLIALMGTSAGGWHCIRKPSFGAGGACGVGRSHKRAEWVQFGCKPLEQVLRGKQCL